MPLLDQGFDVSDPANAAVLARLAASMGIGGSPDASAAGLFGPGATAPPGLGILNGGNFPAAPMVAPPLPQPRPADPVAALPLPTPRPPLAPGAPLPGADAFAAAPASFVSDRTGPAGVPAEVLPAVPDTSLLGRVKQSLSRLGDSIDSHPMTLMALGGGLAGAPSWGSGISRGLTAAVPASRLDMQTQLQQGGIQAAYSALQDHFVRQGDNPAAAGKKALSLVYNPEWMKTFGPQIFGPTEPKTVNYKDQNGIDRTAVFDPREQVLKDIQTGQPIGPRLGQVGPQGAPGAPSGGAMTPAGASNSVPGNPEGTLAPAIMSRPGVSPPLAPPPAGTGNVPAWQEGQIAAANAQSAHARTRAQGGEETIAKLSQLEGMVRDAPEDAFGGFAGAESAGPGGFINPQAINRLMGGMPTYGFGEEGHASGKDLLSAHERLKGAYAGAIEPLSRAISGGEAGQSGGRMNTAILDQAKAIIGGTETSDKETAIKQIQDAKVRAWDGIQEGIRHGVYDPAKLPRADAEQGLAMGRGAIWVDQAGNIRRNKL